MHNPSLHAIRYYKTICHVLVQNSIDVSVLYPTIMAIARHRKPTLQDVDYFDQLEGDRPVIPPDPRVLREEEV